VVGLLPFGDDDGGRGVARVGHLFAPGVFLGEGDGGVAALGVEVDVDGHVLGVGEFVVVVVGFVVHLADVHQLEKLEEVLPEHEEDPVVIHSIP